MADFSHLLDPLTGHFLDCDYRKVINRAVGGIKPYCSNYVHDENGAHVPCSGTLSKQACLINGKGLCSSSGRHWQKYCEGNDWCSDLSRCANRLADLMGLSLRDRSMIDQNDINNVLGLPSDKEYNHISDLLRKVVDENNSDEDDADNGDESSDSEMSIQSEGEEENSDSDTSDFVVPDHDSETEAMDEEEEAMESGEEDA